VAGSCENGNEPSGSIKGGEFLDQLRGYKILKKEPGLCSQSVSQLVSQSVSQLVS
jgi:hypothetical protein